MEFANGFYAQYNYGSEKMMRREILKCLNIRRNYPALLIQRAGSSSEVKDYGRVGGLKMSLPEVGAGEGRRNGTGHGAHFQKHQ